MIAFQPIKTFYISSMNIGW